MPRNTGANLATGALGIAAIYTGINHWQEAMDAAEFARGRDSSTMEQIAHFAGDQPEALELMFWDQNNGPNQTPEERPILNAEISAFTVIAGAMILTTSVIALRK